jgi:uncharacterized membrane protein YqiK
MAIDSWILALNIIILILVIIIAGILIFFFLKIDDIYKRFDRFKDQVATKISNLYPL